MTYVQSSNSTSGQRLATLSGVAILHASLGYVLVTGLAYKITIEAPTIFEATNYPAAQEQAVKTPPPRTDPVIVQPTAPTIPDGGLIFNIGPVAPLKLPPLPLDPGMGLVPARDPITAPANLIAATPRSDPGSWNSQIDYPTSAVREGREGVSRFELTITPEGRVGTCRITASSGHSDLDATTCKLVSVRARFQPARDGAGNKVAGQYTQSVRWEIKPDRAR